MIGVITTRKGVPSRAVRTGKRGENPENAITTITSGKISAAKSWDLIALCLLVSAARWKTGVALPSFESIALLYDPAKKSSEQTEGKMSSLFWRNEMAHQWFGDLVTMAWWDNLWLNEGFALLDGNQVHGDHFNPQWYICVAANAANQRAAIDRRALRYSSHPATAVRPRVKPTAPSMRSRIRRGNRFLRMLESYLGEERFSPRHWQFIQAHKYLEYHDGRISGTRSANHRRRRCGQRNRRELDRAARALPLVTVKSARTAECWRSRNSSPFTRRIQNRPNGGFRSVIATLRLPRNECIRALLDAKRPRFPRSDQISPSS